MIAIIPKYGAEYLAFDEPVKIRKRSLNFTNNTTLLPGEKVVKIGIKKRTSFELQDGFFMRYEGVLKQNNIVYAVFDVPAHNVIPNVQLDLFSKHKVLRYKYVFACAFVKKKVSCFVISSEKGCRDIDTNYILKESE